MIILTTCLQGAVPPPACAPVGLLCPDALARRGHARPPLRGIVPLLLPCSPSHPVGPLHQVSPAFPAYLPKCPLLNLYFHLTSSPGWVWSSDDPSTTTRSGGTTPRPGYITESMRPMGNGDQGDPDCRGTVSARRGRAWRWRCRGPSATGAMVRRS